MFGETGKSKTSLTKYLVEINDFAVLARPHRRLN